MEYRQEGQTIEGDTTISQLNNTNISNNDPPDGGKPKPPGLRKLIQDTFNSFGYKSSPEEVDSFYTKYNSNPSQFLTDFSKETGTELHPKALAGIYNKYFSGSTEPAPKLNPNAGTHRTDIHVPVQAKKQPSLDYVAPDYAMKNRGAQYSEILSPDVPQDHSSDFKVKKDLLNNSNNTFDQSVNNSLIDEHYKVNTPSDLDNAANTISQTLKLPAFNKGVYDIAAAGATGIDDIMGKIHNVFSDQPYVSQKGGLFDELKKNSDYDYDHRDKPEGLTGKVAEGVMSAIPTLLGAIATDGETLPGAIWGSGTVAAGAKLAPEAAPIINHFVKYMYLGGAVKGYGEARDEGKDIGESIDNAGKKGIEGGVEGLKMEGLGLIGGTFGEGVASKVAEALPKTGKQLLPVLKAAATGIAFGGSSAVDDLMAGKPIDDDNVLTQLGVGMAFGGHDIYNETRDAVAEHFDKWKLNDKIKESILQHRGAARVRTLFTIHPDAIQPILDMPGTSDDMQVKSIQVGVNAVNSKDVGQKAKGQVAQLALQNAADLKAVAENIEQDKEGVIKVINDSQMPDDTKQAAIQKVEMIDQAQKAAKVKNKKGAKKAPVLTDPNIGDFIVDHNDKSHQVVGFTDGGYLNEYGDDVPKSNVKTIIRNGEIIPTVEPAVAPKEANPIGAEHISNPLNDSLHELGYSDEDFSKLDDEQKGYIIDNKVKRPEPVVEDADSHKKKVADIFSKIGVTEPEVHAEKAISPVQESEPLINHEQPGKLDPLKYEKSGGTGNGGYKTEVNGKGVEISYNPRLNKWSAKSEDGSISTPHDSLRGVKSGLEKMRDPKLESKEPVVKDDSTPSGIKQPETTETIPDGVHLTRPQVKQIAATKPKSGHIDSSDLDEKGKLEKKQKIQLVVKQKFNDLRSAKGDDFNNAVTSFIHRIMDYRRKGFIKSDKAYTEKNSKDVFNGRDHWIDSTEDLIAKHNNVSKGEAARIIHEAQSDWAKNIDETERGGKVLDQRKSDLGISTEPSIPKVQAEEKPIVKDSEQAIADEPAADHDPIVNNEDSQRVDDYHKPDLEDSTPQPETPKDSEVKDNIDTRLVHVGDDHNGKPILVRAEDMPEYNKTIDIINKKLQRIEDAEDETTKDIQKQLIDKLKGKLKDFVANAKKPAKEVIAKDIAQNKDVVKNLTVQKDNIEAASLIEKAEAYVNKLHEEGSKNLKKARKDMASGGITPDLIKGASQKIAAHLIGKGIRVIKTVEGLRKYVIEMIQQGKLDSDTLDASNEAQQKNVIKLINSHLDNHYGGEEQIAARSANLLDKNKYEAKRIEKDNKGLTIYEKFRQGFTDRQAKLAFDSLKFGNKVINPLSPISESFGEKAIRLFNAMSGSSNRAEVIYKEAYKSIFGEPFKSSFLNENEQKVLSLIINMRRISEIDRSTITRSPDKMLVEHPGGYSYVTAEKTLDALENKTPAMVKLYGNYDFDETNNRASKYFEAMQSSLNDLHENGLISDMSYAIMKDAKYYSPRKFMQYINRDTTFKVRKVTSSNGVKKLGEGSDEAYVDNPAYLLRDAIGTVSHNIDQNNTYKAFNEMLTNISTEMGRPAKYSGAFISKLKVHYATKEANAAIPTATLFGVENEIDNTPEWKFIKPEFETPKDGESLFKFYDKGVQKGFIMNKVYAQELLGFDQMINRRAVSLYSGARLVQSLATGLNPYFAISNTIRDAGFVLFTTNHYSPIFPVAVAQYSKDFASNIIDAWKNGDKHKSFINSGGGREFLSADQKLFAGSESELKQGLNNIWYHLAQRLPQTSEIAGRLAVRDRVIKNLTDEYKKSGKEITPMAKKDIEDRAAYAAASTMDFSQGGRVSKEINSFIPFFNAGILGTRNLARYAKSNPAIFATKLLQLAAINAALAAWNHGLIGDQEEAADRGDAYRRFVSANNKSVNHIIMLPFKYLDKDGVVRYPYIKIPKPQEQKLFSGLFEHLSLKSFGIEDNYLSERGLMDAQSLMSYLPDGSNWLPPIANALLAYQTNYNMYRGEKFYKGRGDLPKAKDQYDYQKTPQSYIELGSNLNMSPDRLKGAFEMAVPTGNPMMDLMNFTADKLGMGSREFYRHQSNQKSWMDQLGDFTKSLDSNDRDKVHQFISESLSNLPGAKRLMGVTTSVPIDVNRKDLVSQGISDKKELTDKMMDMIHQYHDSKDTDHAITEDQLFDTAQSIGSDKELGADGTTDVVRLIQMAKTAIKGKDATQTAMNVRFLNSDPRIQAGYAYELMKGMPDPAKKEQFFNELEESNMFSNRFFMELEKVIEKEDNK